MRAIATQHDRFHGNFTAIFDSWLRIGARKVNATRKLDQHVEIITSRWNVKEGCFPRDIESVDALLVTGSVSAAYDNTPWIRILQKFLNGELCRSIQPRRRLPSSLTPYSL
jgi:hypothetical protein